MSTPLIDDSEMIKFQTYLNYTKSVSIYIEQKLELIDEFIDEIVSNHSYNGIMCKKDIDYPKVARLLRNAWFTEVQLNNLSVHSEYAQFSIHWAQVYSYYTCYLMIRAYFEANKQNVSNKHRQTLSAFSGEINKRDRLFPQPWKTLCNGDPEKDSEIEYLNITQQPRYINQLSSFSLTNYEDTYAKFLKTTRLKSLERLNNIWKEENNKKRVSPDAKKKHIRNLRPTSLFDCLYRMRIRANYENADTFMLDSIEESDAIDFHKSLQNIVYGSALVMELIICKFLSKKIFESMILDFNKTIDVKNKNNNRLPFSRWSLICEKF